LNISLKTFIGRESLVEIPETTSGFVGEKEERRGSGRELAGGDG